jgi:hypothetical protein
MKVIKWSLLLICVAYAYAFFYEIYTHNKMHEFAILYSGISLLAGLVFQCCEKLESNFSNLSKKYDELYKKIAQEENI